jgi:hypothetical protein
VHNASANRGRLVPECLYSHQNFEVEQSLKSRFACGHRRHAMSRRDPDGRRRPIDAFWADALRDPVYRANAATLLLRAPNRPSASWLGPAVK